LFIFRQDNIPVNGYAIINQGGTAVVNPSLYRGGFIYNFMRKFVLKLLLKDAERNHRRKGE
jgi:hypothetical protein